MSRKHTVVLSFFFFCVIGSSVMNSSCSHPYSLAPIALTATATPTQVSSGHPGSGTNTVTSTMTSTPGPGWHDLGNQNAIPQSNSLSFVMSGGVPYVAISNWLNYSMMVLTYNGSSWVTMGNTGFGNCSLIGPALAMNGTTPYVVYQDNNYSLKASVMSYNGSSWVTVGNPGFSLGRAQNPAISIWNGQPFVVYSDVANGYQATAMTFNGTTWVNAGSSSGFSGVVAEYIALGINATNIPYVAFQDASNSGYATVMSYSGNWSVVGAADFSSGPVSYLSLAFNSNFPVVAYEDVSDSQKVSCMAFNGTSWNYVGSRGFSPETNTVGTSLTIYALEPYVGYGNDNSYTASVMNYNGSSWVNVGNADFNTGALTSIAFSYNTPNLAMIYGGAVTVMDYY